MSVCRQKLDNSQVLRAACDEDFAFARDVYFATMELVRRANHRLSALASCAFRDYQRDVVGLFSRAESSSLICNCCQQLRRG
jgi:hypothetical protein